MIEPSCWSRWNFTFRSQRLLNSFGRPILLLNLKRSRILGLLLWLSRLRGRRVRVTSTRWSHLFILFAIRLPCKSLNMDIMRRMLHFSDIWRHINADLRFVLYSWISSFLVLRDRLSWTSVNFDREGRSFYSLNIGFIGNGKVAHHTLFNSAGTFLRDFFLMFTQNRVNLFYLIQPIPGVLDKQFIVFSTFLGVLRISGLSSWKVIIFDLQRSFSFLEACILINFYFMLLLETVRLDICFWFYFAGLSDLFWGSALFSHHFWVFVPEAGEKREVVGLMRWWASERPTGMTCSEQWSYFLEVFQDCLDIVTSKLRVRSCENVSFDGHVRTLTEFNLSQITLRNERKNVIVSSNS